MVQVWMRWCRLCAREDQNDNNSYINVLQKDEEGLPLSDTINKCFSMDIKSSDKMPNVICCDCFHLITTTINLNLRIPKVTAMFAELLLVKTEEEVDLIQIKARHNLECNFKIFNKNPIENSIQFEENDRISGSKITTVNAEEVYDSLPSSGDEISNKSNSQEMKIGGGENIPKFKKKEDKTKPHYCSECQKAFMKFYNYRRHMQISHEITVENKRPMFICGKCGKECKSISSLKEHEFSHSEERTFKCRNCSKAFKSSLSLKQHKDTHNETRYICVVCGLQLNTQQTLRKHMVVHSDEKNYKCDYCGNGYKRAKALKAHLILHTGLRPYACDFCDKTFANVSNCRGHKKKHHPVELAALEASGKSKISTVVIPKLNELRAITASKAEIIRPNDRGKKFGGDVSQ